MNVGSVNGGSQMIQMARSRSGAGNQTVVSPFDRVTLSQTGGPLPIAPTVAPAAAEEPTRRHSIAHGVFLAFMVTGTLLGTSGCATMVGNGAGSSYMLAQDVTGREAKEGYASLNFLDKTATPKGGGIYDSSHPSPDHRLDPLDALDRMLNKQPVFYVDKAHGKTQEVHSWAEVKGLEDMARQSLARTPGAVPH